MADAPDRAVHGALGDRRRRARDSATGGTYAPPSGGPADDGRWSGASGADAARPRGADVSRRLWADDATTESFASTPPHAGSVRSARAASVGATPEAIAASASAEGAPYGGYAGRGGPLPSASGSLRRAYGSHPGSADADADDADTESETETDTDSELDLDAHRGGSPGPGLSEGSAHGASSSAGSSRSPSPSRNGSFAHSGGDHASRSGIGVSRSVSHSVSHSVGAPSVRAPSVAASVGYDGRSSEGGGGGGGSGWMRGMSIFHRSQGSVRSNGKARSGPGRAPSGPGDPQLQRAQRPAVAPSSSSRSSASPAPLASQGVLAAAPAPSGAPSARSSSSAGVGGGASAASTDASTGSPSVPGSTSGASASIERSRPPNGGRSWLSRLAGRASRADPDSPGSGVSGSSAGEPWSRQSAEMRRSVADAPAGSALSSEGICTSRSLDFSAAQGREADEAGRGDRSAASTPSKASRLIPFRGSSAGSAAAARPSPEGYPAPPPAAAAAKVSTTRGQPRILAGARRTQRVEAHSGAIWSLAFSPDARHLASAGQDAVVRVWRIQLGGEDAAKVGAASARRPDAAPRGPDPARDRSEASASPSGRGAAEEDAGGGRGSGADRRRIAAGRAPGDASRGGRRAPAGEVPSGVAHEALPADAGSDLAGSLARSARLSEAASEAGEQYARRHAKLLQQRLALDGPSSSSASSSSSSALPSAPLSRQGSGAASRPPPPGASPPRAPSSAPPTTVLSTPPAAPAAADSGPRPSPAALRRRVRRPAWAPPLYPAPEREYIGHEQDVLDLSWSSTGFLASGSMDRSVRLWHVRVPGCLRVFRHSDFVTAVLFPPMDDRELFTGSIDGRLRRWSIPGARVAAWQDVHEMVTAADLSSDASALVAGTARGRALRFATGGAGVPSLEYEVSVDVRDAGARSRGKKVTGICFPPAGGGSTRGTGDDGRGRGGARGSGGGLSSAATPRRDGSKASAALVARPGGPGTVAPSPPVAGGRPPAARASSSPVPPSLSYASSQGAAHRAGHGRGRGPSPTPPPPPAPKDLPVLISSSDSRIRLYVGLKLRAKFKGHQNVATRIRASFSPDASLVISGSDDGRAVVWAVPPGALDPSAVDEPRIKVAAHESIQASAEAATCAIFAPDDLAPAQGARVIFAAGFGGAISAFEIPPPGTKPTGQ